MGEVDLLIKLEVQEAAEDAHHQGGLRGACAGVATRSSCRVWSCVAREYVGHDLLSSCQHGYSESTITFKAS